MRGNITRSSHGAAGGGSRGGEGRKEGGRKQGGSRLRQGEGEEDEREEAADRGEDELFKSGEKKAECTA